MKNQTGVAELDAHLEYTQNGGHHKDRQIDKHTRAAPQLKMILPYYLLGVTNPVFYDILLVL
jgi:hypothetical protein